MPSEREYLLRLYLGRMDELAIHLKHLPINRRDKAIALHESISNFLKSHIEREYSDD